MHSRVNVLMEEYFGRDEHPYQRLERELTRRIRPEHTVVDAGCGRTAPVLRKYVGSAARLVGVDAVDFSESFAGIELLKGDVGQTGLPDSSVDVVYSRSVMEHVADPGAVFAESWRILRPGGCWLILTPNKWDYASVAARLIPNWVHPAIVRRMEGRAEEDTFPTFYRANDRATVEALAARSGFMVDEFEFLGQYPNYFVFSPVLFRIASQYELWLRRHPSVWWLRGWLFVVLRKS